MPATATIHACAALGNGSRSGSCRGIPTCVCVDPDPVWPPLVLRSRAWPAPTRERACRFVGAGHARDRPARSGQRRAQRSIAGEQKGHPLGVAGNDTGVV